MNILATGTGGFLGKSFLKSFKNHTIFPLKHADDFYTSDGEYYLDLTRKEHAQKLINSLRDTKIDIIFHFAAITPFHSKKQENDFSQDLKMAQQIGAICQELNIPKIVFTSGWIVYDPEGSPPFSEKSQVRPNTDYGRSKLVVEDYFKKNLKPTIFLDLRLSSVYGPGQTTSGLIPNLVRSALNEEKMTINSIDTRRDYLYIGDLMDAFKQILASKIKKNTTLNIGGGKSYRVQDVALSIQEIMQKQYGKLVDLIIHPPLSVAKPKDNRLDISKAQAVIDLQNQTDLSTGLSHYIQWLKATN